MAAALFPGRRAGNHAASRRLKDRAGRAEYSGMGSLANLILGVVVAIAVVLAFGLLLGFVDDMRHEMNRPR
jgi:hypothetical protein